MKKLSRFRLLVTAAISVLMLAGCSASSDGAYFSVNSNEGKYISGAFSSDSPESYESDGYYSNEADTGDYAAKNDEESGSLSADAIQKEMLVYSCNMVVDTLDFDTSLNSFKNTDRKSVV